MLKEIKLQTAISSEPSARSSKHRWLRRILMGVAVLLVLIVAIVGLFIKLQPTPSPLALPAAGALAPVGHLDGAWVIDTGSVAGFRLQETVLGFSNDIIGRTKSVSGTFGVSENQVTSAAIKIDLATVKVGGKEEPQLSTSLNTRQYPDATFILTQPVKLNAPFRSGKAEATTATATGRLSMNGSSHAVTFTISSRRNGSTLQVAGSIPVEFSEWSIRGPAGFGPLGSLANHGVAEFLLVLHQS